MLRSLLCWMMLLAGMAMVGVLATSYWRHFGGEVMGVQQSPAFIDVEHARLSLIVWFGQ